MARKFLVIPAEGDSVSTERWYVEALCRHYRAQRKDVAIFNYTGNLNIGLGVAFDVEHFFNDLHPRDSGWEIHAQGGFGAYVAYIMICRYGARIRRVFFVGGAPAKAMSGIAKFFHRIFIRWWYNSRFEFFADDPNPNKDKTIQMIKDSSTATMRANPELYRNQILAIGHWKVPHGWLPKHSIRAYFVPNGKAPFPEWWNNTYRYGAAIDTWLEHGVTPTPRPGGGFSFYSLMPAGELFKVMDHVRAEEQN